LNRSADGDQSLLISIYIPSIEEKKVKKSVHLILEEEEIIELVRILMDDDPEGALEFLKVQFRGKARDLLESG
jgi:hypothetical protein